MTISTRAAKLKQEMGAALIKELEIARKVNGCKNAMDYESQPSTKK